LKLVVEAELLEVKLEVDEVVLEEALFLSKIQKSTIINRAITVMKNATKNMIAIIVPV
jgi:hypothetical protein